MPGMWELPEASVEGKVIARLKHSITVTDFDVCVVKFKAGPGGPGKWIRAARLADLPLTGLSRKILRRANLLPRQPNQTR
jgi:A/G-specific adenine glycosylase